MGVSELCVSDVGLGWGGCGCNGDFCRNIGRRLPEQNGDNRNKIKNRHRGI